MSGDNVLTRFWAVFVSPGKAMEWVREKPQWLIAGIIGLVGIGIFSAVTSHIAGPEGIELMQDTRIGRMMTEEQLEEAYENALNVTTMGRVTSFFSGGIMVWFITLIYGLFYLLFGKLAGGQGTFKQVMGVTYWAALIPYILGYLV
ncbi:MAG: YIP1 family protein, partial [bacterium]